MTSSCTPGACCRPTTTSWSAVPRDAWRKITLVYYPQLSAYVDEKGKSRPVAFEIPDPLDPARGRIAGTEPKQDTRPVLIGGREGVKESKSRRAGGPGS